MPALSTGWDSTAGSMLLLADSARGVVKLVLPRLANVRDAAGASVLMDSATRAAFDLFTGSGKVTTRQVAGVVAAPAASDCLTWPTVDLGVDSLSWSVGLERGRATAIPVRPLGVLHERDSLAVANELLRAAAAMRESDSTFVGLPYDVLDASHFTLGNRSIIVGTVIRRLNQEANPRVEHRFLVLEGEGAVTSREHMIAFTTQSSGDEASVQTTQMLAVVRLRSGAPLVILELETEEGERVASLVRQGPARWRIAWRSAVSACAQ